MTRASLLAAFALGGALSWAHPARGGLGDPTHGQALFVSKRCVTCHAVRGAGGRIGPDLGRTAVKRSFAEMAAGLWNHSLQMGEKMQEFRLARPSFQGDELSDLAAFLYLLNYFDEPGDPKAGKVLFSQKHCIRCHAVGKEGGSTGPRLDDLPRGTPPLRIAQDLWNHGPAMARAIRSMGLRVPEFAGSEIVDLFAYLRSHGQRQAVRDFRSAGDPEKGRRLFASKGCARCHAVFGRSRGMGPDLGRAELRGSVTQLAGTMWNHWPEMSEAMEALGMRPPTFEDDELADVFAWLFISRYEGPPADRTRGERVYRQKGCAACHGERGEGGVGPALRSTTPGEPRERIVQRMWNHAPQMWERMLAQRVPWPRFEPGELSDLVALLSRGWPEPPAAGRR